MRIEPTGSPPVAPKAGGPGPRAAAPPASGSSEGGGFAPSADLAALLDAVRTTPDVRPDAVEAAAAQLAGGALATPQAAGDAARALVASGDLTANP